MAGNNIERPDPTREQLAAAGIPVPELTIAEIKQRDLQREQEALADRSPLTTG